MEIGNVESGKVTIRVLTTNSVLSTLLTDEKFQGKVIQPQTNSSKYVAEHGLAMTIEISDGEYKRKFLLDTGGPKQTIIENANGMGIAFNEFDKLILSHGHADHYGGVMGVLPKLKEECEIVLSPNSYDQAIILIPRSGQPYYSPETLTEKYRELQK